MKANALSIRPFIGSKDFKISRSFYQELGFKENILAPGLSVFQLGHLSFYLQDAYVKEWIENTMLFLEVDNVEQYYDYLHSLQLPEKFPAVKLMPIRTEAWGRECFLHDPSGILWHVGTFVD